MIFGHKSNHYVFINIDHLNIGHLPRYLQTVMLQGFKLFPLSKYQTILVPILSNQLM